MKVLVTGASGFVGQALLRRLAVEEDVSTVAVSRRGLPASARVEVRQITSSPGTSAWDEALQGIEAVVHLAARVHQMREDAEDPLAAYRQVNTAATLQLARQAARIGVRRFVFVSSVKVNGETGRFNETAPAAATDPYGRSKAEAEEGLRALARETGIEVVIVRPPLVYGPGVRANFSALMKAIGRGWPLPLKLVRNKRSLVAVDNLADFLVLCVRHPLAANETFFVSDGHDLSVPELIDGLARAMGRKARLIPIPAALVFAAARVAGKEALARRVLGSLQVDISKATNRLGWKPPLDVETALRRATRSVE
jgi:nucleoside-diphosphate-sugar epimerase